MHLLRIAQGKLLIARIIDETEHIVQPQTLALLHRRVLGQPHLEHGQCRFHIILRQGILLDRFVFALILVFVALFILAQFAIVDELGHITVLADRHIVTRLKVVSGHIIERRHEFMEPVASRFGYVALLAVDNGKNVQMLPRTRKRHIGLVDIVDQRVLHDCGQMVLKLREKFQEIAIDRNERRHNGIVAVGTHSRHGISAAHPHILLNPLGFIEGDHVPACKGNDHALAF